jgi:hypothetical protein
MFSTPVRRILIIAALLLALLVTLALAVPSVGASIRVFLGLGVSPSDSIIQPTVPVGLSTPIPPTTTMTVTQPAVTSETPTVQPTGNVDLSTNPDIQQVTGMAGWTVLTPTFLPEGYHFDSAYYDSANQLIYLTFLATRQLPGSDLTETKTITLTEAKRNDIVPLMLSPNSTAKEVLVAGKPAAYVIGAWDATFVQNANETNGGHMEWSWRNDLQIRNIFWQSSDIYLVLITDDAQVSKDDLLIMANSVR